MKELIRDAQQRFGEFSPMQRAAWLCVMSATTSRPLISAYGAWHFIKYGPSWRAGAITSIADSTDMEGNAARAFGVTTKLGGTFDRLSDKISFLPTELALLSRGRISYTDCAVRALRDIVVTARRGNVSDNPSSRSPNFNRLTTALRMATNDCALTPAYEIMGAHRAGKLHRISTIGIAASGIYSLLKSRKAKNVSAPRD